MQKVSGIGGVFFKTKDPAALGAWYRDNLGVPVEEWGGCAFKWSNDAAAATASTVWSPFPEDSDYFAPSPKPYMINFRVGDLDAMLAQLRANGCDVAEKTHEMEFGRFGWVMDPEGNRVELWQPAEGC